MPVQESVGDEELGISGEMRDVALAFRLLPDVNRIIPAMKSLHNFEKNINKDNCT